MSRRADRPSTVLGLAVRQILLTLEVDDGLLQLPDVRPLFLQVGVRREKLLMLQGRPGGVGELGQHRLMGNQGQVPLQQVFAILPQLLDEVERVKDGQEYVLLSKQFGEIHLADLAAVIEDGHAVFVPGAGEHMGRARFIHKAHGDGHIGLNLVVQPVDAPLPEKGEAGDYEGDGVCDAGFAPSVAAGDDCRIAEHQVRRLHIGFEPGDGHVGDLKALDFLHVPLLSTPPGAVSPRF